MNRLKRLGTVIAAAIIAMSGAVVAAPAANATIYSSGVFSVNYTGDLYQVDASTGSIRNLTYQDWANLGFPSPRPAQTDFVKYSWSPTVYAVTFFGNEPKEWVWAQVTYDQWQKAGFPAPRNAGWIQGTYFYKWASNPEILAIAPDGAYRKLSYDQWRDAGFPAPVHRSNEGFFKYSWDSTILRMTNLNAGLGYGVSYNEWAANAFPTPQVVGRVPGDRVYQNYRDPTIWYHGPAFHRPIGYSEWRAMGFPSPDQVTPARPTNTRNCDSFRSWREAQDLFEYWYPLYGDVYRLDGNNDGIACNALRGS